MLQRKSSEAPPVPLLRGLNARRLGEEPRSVFSVGFKGFRVWG